MPMRIACVLVLAVLAAAGYSQSPSAKPRSTPQVSEPAKPLLVHASLASTGERRAFLQPLRYSSRPSGSSRDLITAEVLLDRAHHSPGAIDGRMSRNLRNAIAGFEASEGMRVDGELTPEVWSALESVGGGPVLRDYVITSSDVSGPFLRNAPRGFAAQSKLRSLGYRSPVQRIAARFHMSQQLLRALNPGADFSRPGERIVVAALGPSELPTSVAVIEVDKARKAVRAYDAQDRLIATYPATVGSTAFPSPHGTHRVVRVDWNPTYHYDPNVLHFAHVHHPFSIKPGPNNPVGVVRIALSKPGYEIHGSGAAENIGKTQSHGCVRLTNWDATQLARMVHPGTVVEFVSG
jgi:lipoprotein-anchoring transpeptidase ErfK/SrfK